MAEHCTVSNVRLTFVRQPVSIWVRSRSGCRWPGWPGAADSYAGHEES